MSQISDFYRERTFFTTFTKLVQGDIRGILGDTFSAPTNYPWISENTSKVANSKSEFYETAKVVFFCVKVPD